MSVHAEVIAEERAAREKLRNLARARRVKAAKQASSQRARLSRLREVESRMDALGDELRSAATTAERIPIRHELRDLGAERLTLIWGGPA